MSDVHSSQSGFEKRRPGRPKGSSQTVTSLTVLGKGKRKYRLLCLCTCGRTKEIYYCDVLSGKVKSCGCRQGGGTHRLTKTRAWWSWREALRRCYDKESPQYHNYGGRGVTMCARWKESVEAFYSDMGECPADLSLDRVDNENGGYWCGKPECLECGPLGREPNCRWATDSQQNRNRRNNRRITHNGQTKCVTDWAEVFGVDATELFKWVYKYGEDEAIKKAESNRRKGEQ